MGMSASQVRFLSLQNRKNSIGRQLMTLSNRKMALSRDMNTVALRFNNAMNQNVLKWSNDSGSTYNTLSYDLMMRPNDLNTEKPYIVTDSKTGEVVLNNDTIKDIYGNDTGVSYVDIANMISKYSGVTTAADGTVKTEYNRNAGYIDEKGILHGNKAIDNGYFIPDSTKDFSFANNLRYDIFRKMGLITDQDIQNTNNLLIQLYGSPEAEKTGRYPVGSAYGDYYVALAQLDAYKDYLDYIHPHALGDTYGNIFASGSYNGTTADGTGYVGDKNHQTTLKTSVDSKNATATETYTDGVYNYSTVIDGRRDNTNSDGVQTTFNNGASITQSGKTDTDSLSHIDFTTKLVNNGGQYSVGSVATGDTIFTDPRYDVGFSADGKSYSSTLTQNGLVSTYKETGNLLDEALKNSTSLGTYSGALAHRNEVYVTMKTGDDNDVRLEYRGSVVSLVDIDANYNGEGGCNWSHHKYWSEVMGNSEINTRLGNMCDEFEDLIKHINTADFRDSSAAASAKSATIAYLIATCNSTDNWDNGYRDADNVRRCENTRAMAMASGHGLGAWGGDISGHVDHISVAVDTAVAFNVYMTYFKAFQRGSSGSGSIPVVKPTPSLSPASTSLNYQIKYDNLSDINGQVITENDFYTTTDGSAFVNQSKYTVYRNKPSEGTKYAEIYETSTGLTFNKPESGIIGTYYAVPTETSQITYYCQSVGNDNRATSTSQQFEGNNVYGTVYANNKCYYFTNPEGIRQFQNGTKIENISSSYVKSIDLTTLVSGIPIALDNDGIYKIELNTTFKNSKYDTYANGFYEMNDEYMQTLEKNVSDKYDRIRQLEDDLRNVFGGADQKIMDFYDALFMRIAENGWVIDEKTSNTNQHSNAYINNKLQNNDYFVTECKEKVDQTGYRYTTKQATSILKIYSVHDTNAENQAIAEYETEKTNIKNKEAKIDVIMQKLETEQESINSTLESVKKIIKENIDKTFKMFA